MPDYADIFVIGTGPSGMAAARTARMARPELSVTAIRREQSYVPCALPYALGGVIEVDSYLKNEGKLLSEIGITALQGEVRRILPREKQVVLDGGSTFSYGKLIVATGAEPVRLPLSETSAENVFTLRTPADVRSILGLRRPHMRVSVVGGGYIGIEVACMMRLAGDEVALVEMMDRLMPRTLTPEFSKMAWEKMMEAGIAVHLGVGVKRSTTGNDGTVEKLLLADGACIPADLIIQAAGIRPRLALFEEAAIDTKPDGVVVDEMMRTSAPDIYACGDCTHFHCFVTHEPVQGKLATNGIFQGKAAALNAVGKNRAFEGFINACSTDIFGLCIGAVGVREEDAKAAGIETVSGTGASTDAYPMFKESHEVTVKLVFSRQAQQIIGGQVAGTSAVAERIDLIALAIRQKLKAADLVRLNHCAHPVQSGVPAHNPIIMAAEDALRKLVM